MSWWQEGKETFWTLLEMLKVLLGGVLMRIWRGAHA